MDKPGKLHFLLIYPLNTAPSQRFRFEQFFPVLNGKGFSCSVNCFYDEETFSVLYSKTGKWKLVAMMFVCFLRRSRHMFTLGKYDCILIQRGAAPFGPPLFEWIIRFVFRKPIIYDFDDAIWLQPKGGASTASRWLKASYRVKKICSWSRKVVAGNEYLGAYARQFAEAVVIIPTVVDTINRFVPSAAAANDRAIIGWTGSHSTLPYLEQLEPVLYKLQQQHHFEMMVMANKPPLFHQLRYRFVPWSEEAEVTELNKIDIGIMPLPDDEWTKGKCGFKAIQYMALAKPAVVSNVGVNNEIIDDGLNGFLCANEKEWEQKLAYLLEHPDKVKELGGKGRLKIEAEFSLRKAADEWLAVLKDV